MIINEFLEGIFLYHCDVFLIGMLGRLTKMVPKRNPTIHLILENNIKKVRYQYKICC